MGSAAPRNEPEAFRFLLVVIGSLTPVAIAVVFGPGWLALTLLVLAVAVVAAAHVLGRPGQELRLRTAPAHVGAADERRILVIANDTLSDEALVDEIERRASAPRTHVLVLVPALASSGRRWLGDLDGARGQARRRLDEALGRIRADLDVRGEVSDADPLQAVEDVLTLFGADEIVVSTHRERPAQGFEPRLAGLVRQRFALPVAHFVVDSETQARPTDAGPRQ